MNYLISFAACAALTVFAALMHGGDIAWLIISDINVAIFLFIAWAIQKSSKVDFSNQKGEQQ